MNVPAAKSPRWGVTSPFGWRVNWCCSSSDRADSLSSARRRLEESSDGLDEIAARCGFASAEILRRAFLRVVRVAPSAYRLRFRSAARA
jgi:hypothetical protein